MEGEASGVRDFDFRVTRSTTCGCLGDCHFRDDRTSFLVCDTLYSTLLIFQDVDGFRKYVWRPWSGRVRRFKQDVNER